MHERFHLLTARKPAGRRAATIGSCPTRRGRREVGRRCRPDCSGSERAAPSASPRRRASTTRSRPRPRRRSCARSRARRSSGRSFGCSSPTPRRTRSSARSSSPAVERAAVEVLDSQLVDHVWDHLLDSDEAQKLIERIAEAPELRAAIASQGVGLLRDIGRQIRNVAMKLDDGLERIFRRLIGRPRREPTQNIGLVTRSLAMLIDGVILNGIFLLVAALLGFVVSALGDPNGVSTAGLVFGLGSWVVFGSAYLLIFWATAGQTPGMRLISIRIEDHDGSPRLGFRSARRRLVGLILALIPFGLGLLGLLTRDDRRGLWDRRAGTRRDRRRSARRALIHGIDSRHERPERRARRDRGREPGDRRDDRHRARARRRRGPRDRRRGARRAARVGGGRVRGPRRGPARRAALAGRQRRAGRRRRSAARPAGPPTRPSSPSSPTG